MFSMLIVEDERWEREGLVEFLDWFSLGIDTVETACDGMEGLEKALELRPDVVITDIQMPGRNGLEMAKLIREKLPHVHIVVLTGYDDFEYARTALRFNAVDYMLKPVEEDEMREVMQRVVRQCEEANLHRMEEERKQQAYEAGRLISLRNAFAGLIAGTADLADGYEEVRLFLAEGAAEEAAVYAVWAVQPSFKLRHADVDRLEELAERLLDRPVLVHAAGEAAGAGLAMMFGMSGAEAGRQEEWADRLLLELRLLPLSGGWPSADKTAGEWIIGIGEAAGSLEQAPETFSRARQALRYAVWTGLRGAVHIREEEEAEQAFLFRKEAFTRQVQELARQIRQKLGSGSEKEAEEAVLGLFELVAAHPGAGRAHILSLLGAMMEGLWTLTPMSGQAGPAPGSGEALEALMACGSQEEMKAQTLRVVGRISSLLHEKREDKEMYIVNRVTRIVAEQYASPELGLAYLAGQVFVSPNHLGVTFKKKTGKTPIEYIQEYRLARAEELLRTTRLKVSAVAEKVGIPNTSYFGTLFKQAYGMTPGEYQETTQR